MSHFSDMFNYFKRKNTDPETDGNNPRPSNDRGK